MLTLSLLLGLTLTLTLTLTLQTLALNIPSAAPPELRGTRTFVKRDGVDHTIFEHEATGAKIDYVANSGVCETTRGVDSYSGYVSVGKNQSMWFWFFEARHKPKTAPLGLWINGGPGCSSMIGLFQENGPCTFLPNATEPTHNPHSWNEHANMLYVDQPIGVGFSYGDETIGSTAGAAPVVWSFLQAIFAGFGEYRNRDFGLFTESYGGHYGPEFADYLEKQNRGIKQGTVRGREINLIALGINNGWFDPPIQFPSFITYSLTNPYRPLLNASIATPYLNETLATCVPELRKCISNTGHDSDCVHARAVCRVIDDKYSPYFPDVDFYDIRQDGAGTFPSSAYLAYLEREDVRRRIGARGKYVECSDSVGAMFDTTGDSAHSFLPTLSTLVSSGLPTLIWAGDADAVCDHIGNFEVVNNISYPLSAAFQEKKLEHYTTRGKVGGEFKSLGNLSWLRVYEAGHMVMSFQPELSLQVFRQVMGGGGIWGT
ncbi:Alpha/Beta hydrolase protein [Amylocarpus encephaloides]|uniref:Carboxypeptidase n=1 Tax=Amylocarpus encephaloides TaxID=45428 RepID=A0A9P8C4J5_9HELO|nr:Alpha/Beta hydrolase protein [Amylocarpus encephaloides]